MWWKHIFFSFKDVNTRKHVVLRLLRACESFLGIKCFIYFYTREISDAAELYLSSNKSFEFMSESSEIFWIWQMILVESELYHEMWRVTGLQIRVKQS